MSRYIDADRINAKLMDEYHGMISDESMKIYKIMQMLDNAPTADVQEVKHGKWLRTVPTSTWSYRRVCSLCGQTANMIRTRYTYCPWCGAKMDGGESE